MITAITLKCDWAGCKATLTIERVALAALQERGWRADSDGFYGMHLCPEHRNRQWHKVQEQQFLSHRAPSTSDVSGHRD